MITAQDIREKGFEKVRIGGYDMAAVDDFLEELADDVTASQKENAVLKSKMKVLVDKIEEYRSNESALNAAILSAQKLANQIETEAREKADKMIADADAQVKAKLGNIAEQTEIENKRLADAKAASAKFFDGIRAMCNAQLKNIDNISSSVVGAAAAPAVEKAPVIEKAPAARKISAQEDLEETVKAIEASVAKKKPEPAVQFDLSADMEAPVFARDADSTQPFTL